MSKQRCWAHLFNTATHRHDQVRVLRDHSPLTVMVRERLCHLAPPSVLNADKQDPLQTLLILPITPAAAPPANGPTTNTPRFSRWPEARAGPKLRAGLREAPVRGPRTRMSRNRVIPTRAACLLR